MWCPHVMLSRNRKRASSHLLTTRNPRRIKQHVEAAETIALDESGAGVLEARVMRMVVLAGDDPDTSRARLGQGAFAAIFRRVDGKLAVVGLVDDRRLRAKEIAGLALGMDDAI